MKFIISIIALFLAFVRPACAQTFIVDECVTVYSNATLGTSLTTATPVALGFGWGRVKFTANYAIASGTNPTADITIQHCASTDTSTCHDTPATFTQCTAVGNCSTDGYESYDATGFYPEKYVRPKITLGGSSPVLNVTIKACGAKGIN